MALAYMSPIVEGKKCVYSSIKGIYKISEDSVTEWRNKYIETFTKPWPSYLKSDEWGRDSLHPPPHKSQNFDKSWFQQWLSEKEYLPANETSNLHLYF